MTRASLRRLLRGATRRAVDDVAGLLPAPIRIEDDAGRLLLGDAATPGVRHSITLGDAIFGTVIGGAGADRVARLLSHLCEREDEKLALADETLGRYKELTLLYDIADKLSRVLEVDEMARIVVDEARSFLRASGASLLVHDRRRDVLDAIATTDDRRRRLAATEGVEGRVLRTGRAELIEDVTTTGVGSSEPGVCSLMAAPLRTGETVFGILRVTTTERSAWNAGHLKLVTSLAGNAAAAISHAMLHRDRLRQQALRHQLERFVSTDVLEAVIGAGAPPTHGAALFVDASELVHAADPSTRADQLVELVRHATTATLAALMRAGATVQLSHAELIVALFASRDGLPAVANAAVGAATAIVHALDRRHGGFVDRPPGIAVTHAALSADAGATPLFAAVGAAASLAGAADGRILIDDAIAGALHAGLRSLVADAGVVGDTGARTYEVRT